MTSSNLKASEKDNNDWEGLSDTEAKDESLSVYNERELNYLDKYLPTVQNAFDENELYEIVLDCNFDDKAIEKTIKERIRYLNAKGAQYGWNIVDSSHRLKPLEPAEKLKKEKEEKNQKEKKGKGKKSNNYEQKAENYKQIKRNKRVGGSIEQNNTEGYYDTGYGYDNYNNYQNQDYRTDAAYKNNYNNYNYKNYYPSDYKYYNKSDYTGDYNYYNHSNELDYKNTSNKSYNKNWNNGYYYNQGQVADNYDDNYKEDKYYNNYDYGSKYYNQNQNQGYHYNNNYANNNNYQKKRRPEYASNKNYNYEQTDKYHVIIKDYVPTHEKLDQAKDSVKLEEEIKGSDSCQDLEIDQHNSGINQEHHKENAKPILPSSTEQIKEHSNVNSKILSHQKDFINHEDNFSMEEINVNKTDIENLRSYFDRLKQFTIFNETAGVAQSNQLITNNSQAQGIYEKFQNFAGSSIPVFQGYNFNSGAKSNKEDGVTISTNTTGNNMSKLLNSLSINNSQILEITSTGLKSELDNQDKKKISTFSLFILGSDKKQKGEENDKGVSKNAISTNNLQHSVPYMSNHYSGNTTAGVPLNPVPIYPQPYEYHQRYNNPYMGMEPNQPNQPNQPIQPIQPVQPAQPLPYEMYPQYEYPQYGYYQMPYRMNPLQGYQNYQNYQNFPHYQERLNYAPEVQQSYPNYPSSTYPLNNFNGLNYPYPGQSNLQQPQFNPFIKGAK